MVFEVLLLKLCQSCPLFLPVFWVLTGPLLAIVPFCWLKSAMEMMRGIFQSLPVSSQSTQPQRRHSLSLSRLLLQNRPQRMRLSNLELGQRYGFARTPYGHIYYTWRNMLQGVSTYASPMISIFYGLHE